MRRFHVDVIAALVALILFKALAFILKAVGVFEIERFWDKTTLPYVQENAPSWFAAMVESLGGFWGGVAVALLLVVLADIAISALPSISWPNWPWFSTAGPGGILESSKVQSAQPSKIASDTKSIFQALVIDISAVLYPEEDVWVAQGLEFDITAQARSPREVHRRFVMKVAAELAISIDLGLKPLEGIPPAPEEFWKMFKESDVVVTVDTPPLRISEGPIAPRIIPRMRIGELVA